MKVIPETWVKLDIYVFMRYNYTHHTKQVGLVQSGHYTHLIDCSLFSPWYSCMIAISVLSNNRSLN